MEKVLTKRKIKNEFWRRFSCSETMLTILNNASGNQSKIYEEAADPLNGGVLVEMDGSCGIIWGGALASGIRAAAGIKDPLKAGQKALEGAMAVIAAYNQENNLADCKDITHMEKWSLPVFMAKGNLNVCHGQMVKFAPIFHKKIDEIMNKSEETDSTKYRNCATEAYLQAAEILGLKEYNDPAVVAGFAGGVGLSGNVCGALAATLYALAVKYFVDRNKPKHGMLRSNMQGIKIGDEWMNPLRDVSKDFRTAVKGKKCKDITGKAFNTPGELSDFLNTGACDKVMETLKQKLQNQISV